MKAKIRVLDEVTINKIAAGEVVENPASVVKELVENSLDAEAREIVVEVQAGGRVLIRVSDDGIGMGRDDAALALERHATSKLSSIEDLNTLVSLGFRGEALPSIASISKFSILTSLGDKGTSIRVEGGKWLSCDEAVRSRGTSIEVKDLFYNIPVRKKFLRTPASDENEIVKICLLEALARPDIKFQLFLNQKPYFVLQPSEVAQRVEEALGQGYYKELLPLNRSEGRMCLAGYVGNPSSARHNRTGQYLFINGRPVVSSAIAWAVKEAYGTYLPASRYPVFVLWLTLPPDEIDVNVHPQKREVRLRYEADLKRFLMIACREALAQARTSGPLGPIDWVFETAKAMPWDTAEIAIKPEPTFEPVSLPLPKASPIPPNVLATLKGYILTESEKEIALIDQQRAHARILFERLEKGEEGPIEKEVLLIPLTMEFSSVDALKLREHLPELRLMGFEIREFGPNTFVVDAYPTLYSRESLEHLISAYLSEIRQAPLNPLKNRLAEKSSYLSISSEKSLSKEEASRLIKDLMLCEQPWISPLGKPIRMPLEPESIARQFQP